MKTIEDLRSEVRCQALVLVGYSIAKDDEFLSDMAQILMSIAAPSDEDAEELAEAYENMRDYFSKDAAPDLTRPCLLYTSPSPRDRTRSRMPSSA